MNETFIYKTRNNLINLIKHDLHMEESSLTNLSEKNKKRVLEIIIQFCIIPNTNATRPHIVGRVSCLLCHVFGTTLDFEYSQWISQSQTPSVQGNYF